MQVQPKKQLVHCREDYFGTHGVCVPPVLTLLAMEVVCVSVCVRADLNHLNLFGARCVFELCNIFISTFIFGKGVTRGECGRALPVQSTEAQST